MSHTVIGIFDSALDAQKVIDQLVINGFKRDNIDISLRSENPETPGTYYDTEENHSSSIGKFFKNLFTDDEVEVKKYTEVASRGNVVSVYTDSQEEAERASMILDQYGAVDVDDRAMRYSTGGNISMEPTSNDFVMDSAAPGITSSQPVLTEEPVVTTQGPLNESYDDTSSNYEEASVPSVDEKFSSSDFRSSSSSDTINVVEEEMNIGKKDIETGSISVRSRIVERPVEETLRLREERAWIERNPVNRPASEVDFKEETIELTEYAEEPVVSKDARVVEEIKVGKSVEERQETVRGTVRKTEVDVQDRSNRRKDLV